MLKRRAEEDLKAWIDNTSRKPLVIRGARQVGKSTLVRNCAEKNKLDLVIINCEKNIHLDSIFKTLNIDNIIRELEAIVRPQRITKDCILFLDEIQATPHAMQALRYFYEERPEIPVISAGSLIEFMLSDHKFSMPVGRIQYMFMGPLTFREFTEAMDPTLIPYLDGLNFDSNIPDTIHQALSLLQRTYLITGGMPEVVQEYKNTQSLSTIAKKQRDLIDTYMDDFSKYSQNKNLALLQRVFTSVPRYLGQKIKYTKLLADERAADVRSIIDLLSKAQVVLPVFHSHCSGVPLEADIDDKVFKMIFLDVGLANNINGVEWPEISHRDDTLLINEGGIAEQFIGQQLAWLKGRKPYLNYWQRDSKQGRGNAEVDYTIAFGQEIFAVEVKSGHSGTLKSIHQFIARKHCQRAIRFDLNKPSRQEITAKVAGHDTAINFELLSLPLYAVEELPRLLGR